MGQYRAHDWAEAVENLDVVRLVPECPCDAVATSLSRGSRPPYQGVTTPSGSFRGGQYRAHDLAEAVEDVDIVRLQAERPVQHLRRHALIYSGLGMRVEFVILALMDVMMALIKVRMALIKKSPDKNQVEP